MYMSIAGVVLQKLFVPHFQVFFLPSLEEILGLKSFDKNQFSTLDI